jgi:hypothetical protein
MLGAKKPLTLDLHSQVEHPGKDQPHVLSAALNQLLSYVGNWVTG